MLTHMSNGLSVKGVIKLKLSKDVLFLLYENPFIELDSVTMRRKLIMDVNV